MSMTGKHKTEITLEKNALAGWLRGLADSVQAGELPAETGSICLEGYKKMEISFKESYGGNVQVKLSVKFPKPSFGVLPQGEAAGEAIGEEAVEAPGSAQSGLPKYKSLKKHMKQTFKAIGMALTAGQAPPELEARSFLADSMLMVSYSGKGDEFYGAYQGKVQAFEAALNASDLEAMKALFHELAQIKRDCHSRHA
jgi:XXXCH domain-containing protein